MNQSFKKYWDIAVAKYSISGPYDLTGVSMTTDSYPYVTCIFAFYPQNEF